MADLFDWAASQPIPSPAAGFANRNRIYRETKPTHSGKRREVLNFVVKQGSKGATRDEIAAALLLPISTVCGRVNELLNCDPPAVVETTARRMTRAGKMAVVLVSDLEPQESNDGNADC
jgi:hypothetical protein